MSGSQTAAKRPSRISQPPPLHPFLESPHTLMQPSDLGLPGSPGIGYAIDSSPFVVRRVESMEKLQALTGITPHDPWVILYSESDTRTFQYETQPIRIGRERDLEMEIQNKIISRHHCEISMEVHVVHRQDTTSRACVKSHGGASGSAHATKPALLSSSSSSSAPTYRRRGRHQNDVPVTSGIQSPAACEDATRVFRPDPAPQQEEEGGDKTKTALQNAAKAVPSPSSVSSSEFDEANPGTVVVRVYVTDWSSNGTYVNDVRVPYGQRQELRTGDTIGLARVPHRHPHDEAVPRQQQQLDDTRPTEQLASSPMQIQDTEGAETQQSPPSKRSTKAHVAPLSASALSNTGAVRNEEDSEDSSSQVDESGSPSRHSTGTYEYAATLAIHLYKPKPHTAFTSPFTAAMAATPSSITPLSLPETSKRTPPQAANEESTSASQHQEKEVHQAVSRSGVRRPLCRVYMAGAYNSTDDPDSLAGVIISPHSAAMLRQMTATTPTTAAGGGGVVTTGEFGREAGDARREPAHFSPSWSGAARRESGMPVQGLGPDHGHPSAMEAVVSTPVVGLDAWDVPGTSLPHGFVGSGYPTPLPQPLPPPMTQRLSALEGTPQSGGLGSTGSFLLASPRPLPVPNSPTPVPPLTSFRMPAPIVQELEDEEGQNTVQEHVENRRDPTNDEEGRSAPRVRSTVPNTSRDGGGETQDEVVDALPLGPSPRHDRKRRLSDAKPLSYTTRATLSEYASLLDTADTGFIAPDPRRGPSSSLTRVGGALDGNQQLSFTDDDRLLLSQHNNSSSSAALAFFNSPATFGSSDERAVKSLLSTPGSTPQSTPSTAVAGSVHYRVLPTRKIQWGQRIGTGASGEVYCGIDIATSLMVAIKVLKGTNGLPFMPKAAKAARTGDGGGDDPAQAQAHAPQETQAPSMRGRDRNAVDHTPPRGGQDDDDANAEANERANENTLLTMSDISFGCHSPVETLSPQAGDVRANEELPLPRTTVDERADHEEALGVEPATWTATQPAKEEEDDDDDDVVEADEAYRDGNDASHDRIDPATAFPSHDAPRTVPAIPAIHRSHLRELYALTQLRHRRIVRCVGFQHVAQRGLCIFMEYVGGGSLQALIRTFGAFHENLIRLYAIQILEGLEYLTKMHVVHGDLKSANVLVSERGEVKLTDFGTTRIRREASRTGDPLTEMVDELLGTEDAAQGGSLCGTPLYMSPEMIRTQITTTASDVWALGCIVFEMATGGVLPWSEVRDATPLQVIYYIGQHLDHGPAFDDVYQCRAALAASDREEYLQQRLRESEKQRRGSGGGGGSGSGSGSGGHARSSAHSDTAGTPRTPGRHSNTDRTPRMSPITGSVGGEWVLAAPPSPDGSTGARSSSGGRVAAMTDGDPLHPDAHDDEAQHQTSYKHSNNNQQHGSAKHEEAGDPDRDADTTAVTVEDVPPHVLTPTPLFMDFLSSMFITDPNARPTPTELLQHPFITGAAPPADALVARWHRALRARAEVTEHSQRGGSSGANMSSSTELVVSRIATAPTQPPPMITSGTAVSTKAADSSTIAAGVATNQAPWMTKTDVPSSVIASGTGGRGPGTPAQSCFPSRPLQSRPDTSASASATSLAHDILGGAVNGPEPLSSYGELPSRDGAEEAVTACTSMPLPPSLNPGCSAGEEPDSQPLIPPPPPLSASSSAPLTTSANAVPAPPGAVAGPARPSVLDSTPSPTLSAQLASSRGGGGGVYPGSTFVSQFTPNDDITSRSGTFSIDRSVLGSSQFASSQAAMRGRGQGSTLLPSRGGGGGGPRAWRGRGRAGGAATQPVFGAVDERSFAQQQQQQQQQSQQQQQPPPSYNKMMSTQASTQRSPPLRRGAGRAPNMNINNNASSYSGSSGAVPSVSSVGARGTSRMQDHREFLRNSERDRRSRQAVFSSMAQTQPFVPQQQQQQQLNKSRRMSAGYGGVHGGGGAVDAQGNSRYPSLPFPMMPTTAAQDAQYVTAGWQAGLGDASRGYVPRGSGSAGGSYTQPHPGALPVPVSSVMVFTTSNDPNASASSTTHMNVRRVPAPAATAMTAPGLPTAIMHAPMPSYPTAATAPNAQGMPPQSSLESMARQASSGLTTLFTGLQLGDAAGGAGAWLPHAPSQPPPQQQPQQRGGGQGNAAAPSHSVLGAAPVRDGYAAASLQSPSVSGGLTMDFAGMHLPPPQPQPQPPSSQALASAPSSSSAAAAVAPGTTPGAKQTHPTASAGVLGAGPAGRALRAKRLSSRRLTRRDGTRPARGVLGARPALAQHRVRATVMRRGRSVSPHKKATGPVTVSASAPSQPGVVRDERNATDDASSTSVRETLAVKQAVTDSAGRVVGGRGGRGRGRTSAGRYGARQTRPVRTASHPDQPGHGKDPEAVSAAITTEAAAHPRAHKEGDEGHTSSPTTSSHGTKTSTTQQKQQQRAKRSRSGAAGGRTLARQSRAKPKKQ